MALDPFNLEKSFPCPECGHVDSGRGFFTWDMDGKKGFRGKLRSGHTVIACPICDTEMTWDPLKGRIDGVIEKDRNQEAERKKRYEASVVELERVTNKAEKYLRESSKKGQDAERIYKKAEKLVDTRGKQGIEMELADVILEIIEKEVTMKCRNPDCGKNITVMSGKDKTVRVTCNFCGDVFTAET